VACYVKAALWPVIQLGYQLTLELIAIKSRVSPIDIPLGLYSQTRVSVRRTYSKVDMYWLTDTDKVIDMQSNRSDC
jgi:hypothetical protein